MFKCWENWLGGLMIKTVSLFSGCGGIKKNLDGKFILVIDKLRRIYLAHWGERLPLLKVLRLKNRKIKCVLAYRRLSLKQFFRGG
jgi:hypothetical protein